MKHSAEIPEGRQSGQAPESPGEATTPTAGIERVLAEHPFLRGMEPAHLRLLSESAIRVGFKTGDLIFREGDPANRFYLVEQGRVALESGAKDSAPVAVQVIGPGEVLGWSWLFPPYYWHFDARAVEPTTAIFFYGSRLREQCDQDRGFGYEMMKRMAHVVIQRLQATRRQRLDARHHPDGDSGGT